MRLRISDSRERRGLCSWLVARKLRNFRRSERIVGSICTELRSCGKAADDFLKGGSVRLRVNQFLEIVVVIVRLVSDFAEVEDDGINVGGLQYIGE